MRCLSFQVTDTSSKQSVKIFWQLVILKINALSEGKDFVAYLMTFSIRVYLLVYFTWGARKISTENKYVPLLFRLSVPQGLLLSFLQTTIGLKSIYWVSLKGGTFGTIFFLKKAQNISLSCFCKHGTERNDRQTNKQTKERLESRL